MLLPLPDAQASVRSIREGDDESVGQKDESDENQNLGHGVVRVEVCLILHDANIHRRGQKVNRLL